MPAIALSSIPARSAARWRYNRVCDAAAKVAAVPGERCGADADRYHERGLSDVRGQPCPGRGDVRRAAVDGVTRRRHLHESGSLRVRFPSPEAEGLSAVFVNTAGGVAGGDRFDIDIAAGEGARLTVTTAAAEKVYRAAGPGRAAQYCLEGRGGRAPGLAAAGNHSVRPGAGVAPDRYRSGGKRLAAAVRNRGVRPRRDGRADAAGRIRRPLARPARRPAGVCRNRPARRRHRRKAWRGPRSQKAALRSARR